MHAKINLFTSLLLALHLSSLVAAQCSGLTVNLFVNACDQLICQTPWTTSAVAARDAGEKFCVNGLPAFPACGTCLNLPLSAAPAACCKASDYATCFAKLAAANCGGVKPASSISSSVVSVSSVSRSSSASVASGVSSASIASGTAVATGTAATVTGATGTSGTSITAMTSAATGSSGTSTSASSASSTSRSDATALQTTYHLSLLALAIGLFAACNGILP